MPTIKAINNANVNTQNKNKNQKYQIAKDGILVDNFIKDESQKSNIEFNEICDKLMISDTEGKISNNRFPEKKSSFNIKNALAPLLIGTLATIGSVSALSMILLKSSKALKNSKPYEKIPDLARNMNIRQEPQFATYRMLRDPSTKNIAGAIAVFLYSGLTIAAKNFIDGVKEIWVKKQQSDIERDLQESLIEVETKSFSGKIKATNDLLSQNVKYFKKVLNPTTQINFTGRNYNTENKKEDNKNRLKIAAVTVGVVLATVLAGKFSTSNIKKALKNANDFTNDFTEKTIDTINKIAKSEKVDMKNLEDLFQIINAKPEFIKDTLQKLNVSQNEIERFIANVDANKKSVFANAPTALGGIPEKIQYYCYIDEDRGHLYNWILNSENKFTKYIFLSFASISAMSYLFKQGFDAIKEVAVSKENAKTELNLKKRLADVEINNFKSKKTAAIIPLIDNFNFQMKSGKTKEELKSIAENVLLEIKNGPPYIFG